jgi:DNA-binding transcriptional LysR family regulator
MKSVSESARRNFVSQPAVSQAISKLEKTLKTSLCHHKKQQFELTEEGKIVFEKAKDIFTSVRALRNALDCFENKPSMPVYFVTTHSIGLSLLPDFLPLFQERYPDIKVHFLFGGLSQIKGWLKQGIAEFALLLANPDLNGYASMEIFEGSFCLFKHDKELRSPSEVGVYVENEKGLMVTEFMEKYKKEFPIRAELNSWELIARSMKTGKGYGFIPDFITCKGRYSYLKPHDRLKISYKLAVISSKGIPLSYSATEFIKMLKDYICI